MTYFRFLAAFTIVVASQAIGRGEFILTAEFAPTIGLDGFSTYRITATSDLGNVVAFDFTSIAGNGILGPVSQLQPVGQPTIFTGGSLPTGAYDPSQDTQFLIPSGDVVSIHTSESASSLHGAFALIGDKQLSIGNSVPFLQVATADSSAVTLRGEFVVRRPDDVLLQEFIDIRLSDILVAPAPQLAVLPPPPPPPPPTPVEPPPAPPVEPPLPPPVITNPPPSEVPPPSLPPIVEPPLTPPPVAADPPTVEPVPDSDGPPPPYRTPYILPIDRPHFTICGAMIDLTRPYVTNDSLQFKVLPAIDHPIAWDDLASIDSAVMRASIRGNAFLHLAADSDDANGLHVFTAGDATGIISRVNTLSDYRLQVVNLAALQHATGQQVPEPTALLLAAAALAGLLSRARRRSS